MHSIFSHVFIKKDLPFDDCINYSFWALLFSKNTLKWLFFFLVAESYRWLLLAVLLTTPFLKFSLIGIRCIKQFLTKFKGRPFLIFIIVEEIPVHIFFPRNIIYLHTLYYKIYDKATWRDMQILCELLENLVLDLYLIDYFRNGKGGFSIIAMFLIILGNICLIYFLGAKVYYFFFDPSQKEDTSNKDFYGITIGQNKPIPYEIRNMNEKRRSIEEEKASRNNHIQREGRGGIKEADSTNYNLVNSRINN